MENRSLEELKVIKDVFESREQAIKNGSEPRMYSEKQYIAQINRILLLTESIIKTAGYKLESYDPNAEDGSYSNELLAINQLLSNISIKNIKEVDDLIFINVENCTDAEILQMQNLLQTTLDKNPLLKKKIVIFAPHDLKCFKLKIVG